MTTTFSSRYRVLRSLGSGGMGEVLLAEDGELQRRVALKLMSPALAVDANERKRFRAEARMASGLTHPNICVVYEVGETEDGRPFLAMEYLEGQTLEGLKAERRLRLREVLRVGIEVAHALQAAHEFHLAHRDIKPSNIMFDARGRVKVLDFGVAKRVGQEELGAVTQSAPQTRTGALLGTLQYMSPEQALGREVDCRTDIFSLGVVLYELVAGQRPFGGRSLGEVINNIINQQPAPLELDNPRLSPLVNRVLGKCLEKDPALRYQSAAMLAKDLAAIAAAVEREAAAEHTGEKLSVFARFAQLFRARRPWAMAAIALVLLGALGGGFLWQDRVRRGNQPPAPAGEALSPKSVAVLPFDNFSAERDTDYLSDGFTDEITTALSKLPDLKVVSRNSSFTFKGKREDLRQVGRALRAGTVLEGSVRKAGNRIRVSAQLINTSDGYHLWSETYDRPLDDLIAVQEEIANRIAARLQTESTPLKRRAVAPEAHQLYLQARLFWNKRSEAGLKRAIDLYQQAIEKDPTYAKAHAALASSYLLLPQYSESVRSREFKPLARAAAERALELEPGCAEAHAVLGMLQKGYNKFKAAEEHFQRALQSEPNNETAHHWYGLCLEVSGRREQALAELQKALELDPLSPIIHTTIPEWYYMGRDYDRAILEARKESEAFPNFAPVRAILIAALMKKEQYTDALAEIAKAEALLPDQPQKFLPFKGFCLARLGRDAEARQLLAELERQLRLGKPAEGGMAFIYQGLREYDKELDLAEQIRLQEGLEPEILSDPSFDEIRHLPQFQALLQRAGLTNAPAP